MESGTFCSGNEVLSPGSLVAGWGTKAAPAANTFKGTSSANRVNRVLGKECYSEPEQPEGQPLTLRSPCLYLSAGLGIGLLFSVLLSPKQGYSSEFFQRFLSLLLIKKEKEPAYLHLPFHPRRKDISIEMLM